MGHARRRATYEDLLKVPEPLVAEIIDGDLITTPRPAVPHARATWVIAQDVGPFDREPGSPDAPSGWWILFEPEPHFDEDVLVPDLAGWRRARMPVLPNAAALTQAPDWLCEVVSPATGAIDRGRKMRVYARQAVEYLWLVDPLAHTLEIYRLEGGRWVVASTHGGADIVRAEPFDTVEIAIGRWWLAPAPPAP